MKEEEGSLELEPDLQKTTDQEEKKALLGLKINLQETAFVGYLSLLVFGLIRETITYGILDINIVSYSSVLDILLSPLNIIMEDLLSTVIMLVIPFLIYWVLKYMKKFHYKNREEKWYQKWFNVADYDKMYDGKNSILLLAIFMVYGVLLGFVLAESVDYGLSLKEELNEGSQKMTHEITFNDKEQLKVKIIGQNSQYIFYALEKEKEILISPIQGNIKRIRQLKK